MDERRTIGERLDQLLRAARRIADPNDPLGRRARERLRHTTGLSVQGIELALQCCLEIDPSPAELAELIRSAPRAAGAHVLLPANVFVAAHRAIALALSASARVAVRPSRRDPVLAELLAEAAPGLFRLVPQLAPAPGEHLWAYGSDTTLAALRRTLPTNVVLHAHGPGVGVAVVDASTAGEASLLEAARALALDISLFDQRGCLSPRVGLVLGSIQDTRRFARLLADALARFEVEVPRGELSNEEAAELVLFRDTMAYAGELLDAGRGLVAALPGDVPFVMPAGRSLQLLNVADEAAYLSSIAGAVTTVGAAAGPEVFARVCSVVPNARVTRLGTMQTPPFDGPADRRGQS